MPPLQRGGMFLGNHRYAISYQKAYALARKFGKDLHENEVIILQIVNNFYLSSRRKYAVYKDSTTWILDLNYRAEGNT